MARVWGISMLVWRLQRKRYKGMSHFLFEVPRFWLRKVSQRYATRNLPILQVGNVLLDRETGE